MLFLGYEDTLHVFGVLLEGFIHYTHNCLWGFTVPIDYCLW